MLKLIKTKTIPDTITNDNLYINSTNGKMYLDTDDKRISLGGASTDSSYPNTAPGDINYVGRFDIPAEAKSIDTASVISTFKSLYSYSDSDTVYAEGCGYVDGYYYAIAYGSRYNITTANVYKCSSNVFTKRTVETLHSFSKSHSVTYSYDTIVGGSIVKDNNNKDTFVLAYMFIEHNGTSTIVSDTLTIKSCAIENISSSSTWTSYDYTDKFKTTHTSGSYLFSEFNPGSMKIQRAGSVIAISFQYRSGYTGSYYKYAMDVYKIPSDLTSHTFTYLTVSNTDNNPLFDTTGNCYVHYVGTAAKSESSIEKYNTSGSMVSSYKTGTGSDGGLEVFQFSYPVSGANDLLIYRYSNDSYVTAITLSLVYSFRLSDSTISHDNFVPVAVVAVDECIVAAYKPWSPKNLAYILMKDKKDHVSSIAVPCKDVVLMRAYSQNGFCIGLDNLDGTEDRYRLYTPEHE